MLIAVVLLTPVGESLAESGLIAPGATLQTVYQVNLFYEGPTWDPVSGKLYFTTPNDARTILRLDGPHDAFTWMSDTQGINGTYLGVDARLLCAQGEAKRVISVRIGPNGPEDEIELAADPAWNAPNDLVQTLRGDIYFTTPDFATRTTSAAYRIAPDGTVTQIFNDMTLPNGIIASLDGTTLYVGDSHEKWWRSYPIHADGSVGAGALFFDPGVPNQNDPDGMSIDELGNLYFTGRGGVFVVSPAGEQLDFIPVPEFVTNCTFSGPEGKTLYLTCAGRVYSLAMTVRGGQFTYDCNGNGFPDACDIDCDAGGVLCTPGSCGQSTDCNDNGMPDDCEPDNDGDGLIDECDPDDDNDGVPDELDNCPFVANPDQADSDNDGVGDACDACPLTLPGLAVDDQGCSVFVPGDMDRDGDVDLTDFGLFQACMTGTGTPQNEPACALARLNAGDDVDAADLAVFLGCLSGSRVPADPACAE